jgi:AcrR family transcriptional regulator
MSMPMPSSKRPRRKANQARARLTVELLLEAAARVLMKRGYAAASTNRIAEAAGVSIGTLYEYFADKEAVFDALIQREIEALVAAIRDADLRADASLGVTLERLLRLAMSALHRGPGFLRALEQVPGSALRRRLVRARAQVVEFVRQLLETHRAALRVTELDLAALIVVSAAEGIVINASDESFDVRLASEVGALLNLYLTGEEPR